MNYQSYNRNLNHDLNKFELEKAIELRNFEIDNFWKRGWFFGALLIALFAAYYTLKKGGLPNWALCASLVVFLVSFVQGLMNRGSKYWQERWEYVTKNKEAALRINLTRTRNPRWTGKVDNEIVFRERALIDACILAKEENWFTSSKRCSVSKLTFLIWDLLTICSLSIWIREILLRIFRLEETNCIKLVELLGFHLVIFSYVVIFFISGKVFEPLAKDTEDYYRKHRQSKSKYYPLSEAYVNNENFEME